MVDSVIGALRIVLGADTAALDKGLKDAQGSLASFAKSVTTIAAGIGLEKMLEGFISSSVAAVKAGIELGDQLNKMSQSVGVSVEELSRLKFAAELSDVSVEALGKSLGKLSKALVAAGSDATSQAGRAFAAMGVEVKNADGSLRASSDVLSDIADKFTTYRDGAEKTSLAIALFGKAGASLIPLLNQGRDGLKEAGDEAERFGLVLDKKTALAAESFNDNLKRLDSIKQGLFVTISARLLPALEQLSQEFLETKKNSTFTADAADFVTSAIKFLSGEILLAIQAFRNLGSEIGALKTFLTTNISSIDDLKAAWNKWGDTIADNEKKLQVIKNSLNEVFKDQNGNQATTNWTNETLALRGLNREVTSYGEAWKSAAPIVGEATSAARNALDTYIASQSKNLAGQQAEIQTFGLLAGAREALKIQLQALSIAESNHTTITVAQQAQLDILKQKTADYATTLAGLQLTQANLTPAQQFQLEQSKIQALFDAGKISADTYGNAMQAAAEKANATWQQAGGSIAGSFATISAAFGKENKAMAKAAQIFGAIQATISMFTGAAKALELPFPANLAAMAAVLAQGARLVAQIKSQSVPTGLAMGGAFTVPGGAGGGDKVPFHAMLEPGETVEVSSNHANGHQAGSGSAPPTTVNMSVPRGSAFEFTRNLIEEINSAVRDGYRINVVPA